MVSMVSRTGRQDQRYNMGGCRQVVGCIPYRYKNEDEIGLDGYGELKLEVLVISSQKGKGMLFPKGGWEKDESKEAAASRETLEEAGVQGKLGGELGKWDFKSKRYGTFYEGYMFPLLVKEQLESWPEAHVRSRQWMNVEDAREVCQHSWMKEALDVLVHRLMNSQEEEAEAKEDKCALFSKPRRSNQTYT